jgi:hypothetical protein
MLQAGVSFFSCLYVLLSLSVCVCVGCVLRIFYFLEAWEIFLIQFFFWVGFASSFKNLGLCGCLCGF